MHRLIQMVQTVLVLSLLFGLGAPLGCATQKEELKDPAYVEKLRLRITKVRGAIRDTRQTIAASQGAPYLAELYVRLAELLSEEARYHYQLAYEREQRSTKVLHVPQVRFLKEQAIATYRRVLKSHPETKLGPQIHFNIGHEQRELGNYDDMKKALQDLADKYPDSPLRGEALLVLGDHEFDRNNLDEAEKAYADIVKGKASKVDGLAYYKLAWVRVNRGDCKNALSYFEKAIDVSQKWIDLLERAKEIREAKVKGETVDEKEERTVQSLTGSTEGTALAEQDIDVRREALVDLTYCYSRQRKPSKAVGYLKKRAYNRATYIASLEKMASRFGIMNQARGGIDVTRELLRLAPDAPDRLDDARMLYASLKRAKTFSRIGTDIRVITGAMLRQIHGVHTKNDERERLLKEFEAYARDLTTRSQEAAYKVKDAAKKKARLEEVSRGYMAYLDAFPNSDSRIDMLQNLADTLNASGHPLEAGRRAFEAATLLARGPAEGQEAAAEGDKKEAPKPKPAKKDEKKEEKVDPKKLRQDLLYDAVVFFQDFLDGESPFPEDRVVARASLRRAASDLLKFNLTKDKARKVKFAIAQSYYDEGSYRDAIDRLTAVAYEYPASDESKAAIRLVLDSYNTINDFDGLMAAGRRFMGADSPADATLKGEIKPIVAAAEQRRLDEVSLETAGEEGGDLTALLAFAETYEGTDLGERALLNAFVAARAVGNSKELYRIGAEVEQKYPKSEQLPGILSTLGQTAAARYEFDRAIDFFEKSAAVNPAQKITLLVAAGELKEQLADVAGAKSNYQKAMAAADSPQAREAPAGNLAALIEREGNASAIISELSPLADDRNPEVLARLGLAQLRKGDPDNAEVNLQGVLEGQGAASAEAQARAHYGMAEVLLAALDQYEIGDDVDMLQEFISVVEVTEQSYLNAARQGSPAFAAASLGRLSFMANKTAARFDSVKAPAGLSPAEQAQVKKALKSRADQLRQLSKDALEACANQGWSNKVFQPAVRVCLAGKIPEKDPVAFDTLKPRKRPGSVPNVEEIRQRLSKNPDDAEALSKLGLQYLKSGDAHAARLVFAQAAAKGGGAEQYNLLGLASAEIGDHAAALEAFASAAEAGSEAGRQNLAKLMRRLNLGAAAKQALKKYPEGKPGGRSLGGGGGA
jgi:tetratricopeptide (TPR) repeat protein